MDRVSNKFADRIMSADEAAKLIKTGMTLGCSGFTLSGDPKAIPAALVRSGAARELTVLTGASVGDALDGALARAGILARRHPYQSSADVRKGVNSGQIAYADMHLSHMPAYLDRGSGPNVDVAVIECTAVTEKGLIPAAAVGASDCFVRNARQVIVELNSTLPEGLAGIHDIYQVGDGPIPLRAAGDRIGLPYIPCPPEKLAAIVLTDMPGKPPSFKPADEVSGAIAENIVRLLRDEVAAGRQPAGLTPLQSGVGSVANAVLSGLSSGGFEGMTMFTEVLQDSALELVRQGRITSASATSLSLSADALRRFREDIGFYREHIVLRNQEVSNHPELARRLALISLNTPIEFDIYGNVNSTHIMGTRMMNGIGGSGDFARNAGLTIFSTESVAKGGSISCVVPMCSHVDHTEHDIDILVTEQGWADLRWKSPRERAELIIENCSHPDYRPLLREYYRDALKLGGHTPHDLTKALSWHVRYNETGSMK